jgi:hypothetical protein
MRRYASLNIQFSRGCPFNCDFCNITTLFGHTPRIKSPQQVLAELEAIYQAGWRGNIFFVDDNFIGNKRSLKRHLLPALIEWRKTHNQNRNLLLDVQKIHRSGLQVMAGFIVGFDSDTPSIFQRQIDFIQKSGKVPTATIPANRQRLLAFFRACLRIGVLGKERFQYWHLLMWTLVWRPRLMPLAVTLAIYGYHYRKICERHLSITR